MKWVWIVSILTLASESEHFYSSNLISRFIDRLVRLLELSKRDLFLSINHLLVKTNNKENENHFVTYASGQWTMHISTFSNSSASFSQVDYWLASIFASKVLKWMLQITKKCIQSRSQAKINIEKQKSKIQTMLIDCNSLCQWIM